MLLRTDEGGVLAIGQPSHAWVSGQLARAWGNARFPAPEPREEVQLAAEQHDLGFAGWDLEPARNPATGLPYSFMEMPLEDHLRLWSAAPRGLVAQSRYAALLVSMHGARLYRRRDLDELSAPQAAAVRAYLDRQRRFQEQLIASFAALDRERLARNSQLVWTWDFISLAVCLDWAPRIARAVPAADGAVDIELSPADAPRRVSVEPWPFAAPSVTVRCEGRRLAGSFASDADLRAALARAPWEQIEFELVQAAGAPTVATSA